MTRKIWIFGIFLLLFAGLCNSEENGSREPFYARGRFYLDWFGVHERDAGFFSQLSTRVKLELFNRRGSGWTFTLDARDRYSFNKTKANQVILYDTAGIGQILGGILGFKPVPELSIGGYGGLESNIYVNRLDRDYHKFGLFTHYTGTLGRRFSLSYNHIRYSGMLENQYLYLNGMYPLDKYLVIFGNMEYQLGSNIGTKDRLSRLFLNVRFDPASWIDLSAFYSSGKGLDFHRFVLDRSQDPVFNDQQIDRYYYSTQYGIRVSIKPAQSMRLFVSRQERENVDDNIQK